MSDDSTIKQTLNEPQRNIKVTKSTNQSDGSTQKQNAKVSSKKIYSKARHPTTQVRTNGQSSKPITLLNNSSSQAQLSITPSTVGPKIEKLANQQSEESDVLCPTVVLMGYNAYGNDLIGEGAFSKVYRARSNMMTNKAIAVKIVRLDDPNIPQAWKDHSMKRELKILKKIKHPNIITIFDVIKTRSRIFIFMDLAVASITGHLMATGEPASEQTTRNWFGGISNAVAYLHRLELAHRDMKNDNILIDSNGNAKLTDFGFACFTYDKLSKNEILSMTCCGTKAYTAPEVFSPPYNAKAADVWSIGICLFECVTLCQPFRDDLPLVAFIRRQLDYGLVIPRRFSEVLSESLQDLLMRMIEPDVSKRIRSEGIIVHPWMKQQLGKG